MKKQLFPKEFLKHSVEVHQFKHSKRSRNIYWTLLLLLLFVILALPLVKVNVYTTVRGIIKPEKERQSLRFTTAGKVMYSKLSNNSNVTKGDTLLFLASSVLDEKKHLLNQKMKEHQGFLHDLAALKQNQITPQLNTPTYKKQWRAFQTKANELNLIKTKLEKDLKRAESLFEKGIIPSVEWETAQHQYTLAIAAEEQFLRESVAQWETETHELTDEQQRLSSNSKQLKQQQQAYYLIAPTAGTRILQEGIDLGSWVQADQILVMKNGEVIEAGNHLDLIEKEGVYHQLWQQQMII